MAQLDGWSLNEELKVLKDKLKRHENIIGALAVKVYAFEDALKVSAQKKTTVKKVKTNGRTKKTSSK
jgi:hypothetical protein